jgi:hypothetical protein
LEELEAPVRRPIVERDYAIDVRRDVRDEPREESHLVANGEEGVEPRPPEWEDRRTARGDRKLTDLQGVGALSRPTDGRQTAGDIGAIVAALAGISRRFGVPPVLTVAVAIVETRLTGLDQPGNPHHGWFQMQLRDLPYPTSVRPPTLAEAHDLGYSATEFCRAAVHHADEDPRCHDDLWRWAVVTQGVQYALDRNPAFGRERFASALEEAERLVERHAGSG